MPSKKSKGPTDRFDGRRALILEVLGGLPQKKDYAVPSTTSTPPFTALDGGLMDAARSKTSRGEAGTLARRCRELIRLFQARYGYELPNDDAGREDALIYLDHAVHRREGVKKATNFLEVWCPWMQSAERDLLIGYAINRSKFWKAEELGNALNLSKDERVRCRITSFRAAGMDDAAMALQRKQNKALSARQSRAKAKRRRAADDGAGSPSLGGRHSDFEKAVAMLLAARWTTTEKVVGRLAPAFPNLSPKSLTRKINRALTKLIGLGECEEAPHDRAKMEARRVRRRPQTSAVHA